MWIYHWIVGISHPNPYNRNQREVPWCMEMGMPGIDETIAGSDYSGHLWVDENWWDGDHEIYAARFAHFLDTHCFWRRVVVATPIFDTRYLEGPWIGCFVRQAWLQRQRQALAEEVRDFGRRQWAEPQSFLNTRYFQKWYRDTISDTPRNLTWPWKITQLSFLFTCPLPFFPPQGHEILDCTSMCPTAQPWQVHAQISRSLRCAANEWTPKRSPWDLFKTDQTVAWVGISGSFCPGVILPCFEDSLPSDPWMFVGNFDSDPAAHCLCQVQLQAITF